MGARFGTTIESKEKKAQQTRLILSNPRDCCNKPKNKVLMFKLYSLDIHGHKHQANMIYVFFNINVFSF